MKKSDSLPHCIALVDCNNFYVSCERVFNPRWKHIPMGVLSNNDGCIIARSNELKEAGIKMGAPYFKHRKQLDQMGAVILSSNYTLYGDLSSRVMNILSQFTPNFEIYSIDEAWLDLTGFNTETLHEYAQKIVSKTHQYTGIPVSMGIGSTKTLAKIANHICKKQKIPSAVFNLNTTNSIDDILESVEVGDVWGIGQKWSRKLKYQGILSALDLKRANPIEFKSRYSIVMQRIIYELNGIQCLTIEDPEPKKQIISSRSFGQKVTEKRALFEAISLHSTQASEKLRAQNSVCGCISVFIQTSRFNTNEPYYSNSITIKLASPTCDTRYIIDASRKGIDRLFKHGYKYAKAGVMLMDIRPNNTLPMNLFLENDTKESIELMNTIDQINTVHGKHTIRFASEGTGTNWTMKQDRKTPCFTTNWNELPIALAN